MIKKLLFFIFLFLLLTTAFLFSQERITKIFFVNLYAENVDVQLGEENNFVFKMEGLEPYSSTYMLKTTKTGQYKLYFKKSSDSEYFFWSKDGTTPIKCDVEAGKSHCILIDYNGAAEYFTLEENFQNGASVCFLNGSDSLLTKMEVGTDWETNTVAFVEDLDVYMITNFVTFNPGKYSLFWQYPAQKEKKRWFYLLNSSGKDKEILNFTNGSYYLFLAYTDGRNDYAKLINITPKN